MEVKGIIVDNATGMGIPFASIQILNSNGSPTGTGTIADQTGQYDLVSNYLDDQSTQIQVSSVGYGTQSFPVNSFVNYGGAGLDAAPKTLNPVTVTAKTLTPMPGKTNSSLPLILLGAGGLFLLSSMGKKKKVGKVDSQMLLIIGGMGIAGFLAYKLISKPTTTTTYPYQQQTAAQVVLSQPQGNTTASVISASGQAAAGILQAISNF